MHNTLTELTDIVINDIIKDEIVLPSAYKEKFEQRAKELDIIIEDEVKLIEMSAEKGLAQASSLMQSTRKSVHKLETFANDASSAIKKRDEKALEKIALKVADLKKEIQRINRNIYLHSLTKAYNRTWISEQLLKNDIFQEDGTLSYINISKFSLINEKYGHLVGDKILIFVANFLKQKSKSSKVVHYSSDRFLIFSIENLEMMHNLLQDYSAELEEKKLKAPNGDAIFISFHYGIVEYQENDIFRDALEMSETLMLENKTLT